MTGPADYFGSPGDWRRRAACKGADTDLFFPDSGQGAAEARAVCTRCPVKAECLEFALACGPMLRGVWGGTTERTRRRLRADRTRAAKVAA
jgi:WhiB family redox-sensing transcriptional regulator